MTEEAPENLTASKADDVEMMVAYAALPQLADVHDHLVALASRYGQEVTARVRDYLREARELHQGVRVFNQHRDLPIFSPGSREERDKLPTVLVEPFNAVKLTKNLMLAGLLSPLPGGRWRYDYVMTDGSVRREVVTAGASQGSVELVTKEVPAEPELSAARYTVDTDLLYLSKEFVRVGVGIAAHLRDTADKVERHARNVRPDLSDLKLDHNYAASEILHDINTLHGNLNTSGLLRAAADADRHARNPKA